MGAVFQVVLIGIALASLWFWIVVGFRVIDPRERFWWWLKIIVPQGILVAWALRVVLKIAIRLFL